MSRLAQRFEQLKARGEKALVCFVTAGDPSFERAAEIIVALGEAGADAVEIGIAFSDPACRRAEHTGVVTARAGRRHDHAQSAGRGASGPAGRAGSAPDFDDVLQSPAALRAGSLRAGCKKRGRGRPYRHRPDAGRSRASGSAFRRRTIWTPFFCSRRPAPRPVSQRLRSCRPVFSTACRVPA